MCKVQKCETRLSYVIYDNTEANHQTRNSSHHGRISTVIRVNVSWMLVLIEIDLGWSDYLIQELNELDQAFFTWEKKIYNLFDCVGLIARIDVSLSSQFKNYCLFSQNKLNFSGKEDPTLFDWVDGRVKEALISGKTPPLFLMKLFSCDSIKNIFRKWSQFRKFDQKLVEKQCLCE